MLTFSLAGTSLGDCRFNLLLNRRKVERRSFCIGGNSIAVRANSPTFCCT